MAEIFWNAGGTTRIGHIGDPWTCKSAPIFYNKPTKLLKQWFILFCGGQDLDLRLQHFHSFSQSNWGGHYHYDTTPNTVEYEAYLNLAERVVRVDKPLVTHKFGRD